MIFDNADPAWVERVAAIAPILREEGVGNEARGRVSDVAVQALEDAGVYRVSAPVELGGDDAELTTLMRVIEEISRADAATGWCVMVGALNSGWFGAVLPEPGAQATYRDGMPRIVGMPQPRGRAERVDGGYAFHGSFQFASGSSFATHFSAAGALHVDGEKVLLPDGSPETIVVLLSEDQVTRLGNWDVGGLSATTSIDFDVPPLIVPEELTTSLLGAEIRRGGTAFHMGLAGVGRFGHAAVAIGFARRALEEIVELAPKKARPGTPSVAEQQLFRHELAGHDAAVWAARTLTYALADDLARAAQSGSLRPGDLQRARQVNTYVHDVAAAAVDFAYRWSGTTGLRKPNVLGQLFRDMHAATQHFLVDRNTLVDAAPVAMAALAEQAATHADV